MMVHPRYDIVKVNGGQLVSSTVAQISGLLESWLTDMNLYSPSLIFHMNIYLEDNYVHLIVFKEGRCPAFRGSNRIDISDDLVEVFRRLHGKVCSSIDELLTYYNTNRKCTLYQSIPHVCKILRKEPLTMGELILELNSEIFIRIIFPEDTNEYN